MCRSGLCAAYWGSTLVLSAAIGRLTPPRGFVPGVLRHEESKKGDEEAEEDQVYGQQADIVPRIVGGGLAVGVHPGGPAKIDGSQCHC